MSSSFQNGWGTTGLVEHNQLVRVSLGELALTPSDARKLAQQLLALATKAEAENNRRDQSPKSLPLF